MADNYMFNKSLRHTILAIVIPISLQSLFQSSLSVIDQVMVGQLGTDSITSIGIGSKFMNLFVITVTAIGTAASIMISQYCGSMDVEGVNNSFNLNLYLASIITAAFFLPSVLFSGQIVSFYTTDPAVIHMAAGYLRIVSIGYIPLLFTTMLSTLLRNTGCAKSPMVASIVSVFTNTFLNYILIFGRFGMPRLGVYGTAAATTAARTIESLILFILFFKMQKTSRYKIHLCCRFLYSSIKQTLFIACPIVVNEFLWGFGDTMYSVVYGHIGTAAMAAMTLTWPIQNLCITGLFTGVSTAAAIITGNFLGKGKEDFAFELSSKFLKAGVIGSASISVILFLTSGVYSNLFNIPSSTKQTTRLILYVFAAVLFVKVSNMILGGILRSGGKTKYTLFLDVFGTWGIGVPIGFISAFLWHLPIQLVYFLISTEEMVRLALGIRIFRTRKWIERITESALAS